MSFVAKDGRGALKDILRKAWKTWKRYGQFIGDLIGRAVLTVLTVLYFHWNVKGNQLAAQTIVKYLKTSGLVSVGQ